MKDVSKEQTGQTKQIDRSNYLRTREPQRPQAEGPQDYRHKAFHTMIRSDLSTILGRCDFSFQLVQKSGIFKYDPKCHGAQASRGLAKEAVDNGRQ